MKIYHGHVVRSVRFLHPEIMLSGMSSSEYSGEHQRLLQDDDSNLVNVRGKPTEEKNGGGSG